MQPKVNKIPGMIKEEVPGEIEHVLNWCKEKGIKLEEVKPKIFLVPKENIPEVKQEFKRYKDKYYEKK